MVPEAVAIVRIVDFAVEVGFAMAVDRRGCSCCSEQAYSAAVVAVAYSRMGCWRRMARILADFVVAAAGRGWYLSIDLIMVVLRIVGTGSMTARQSRTAGVEQVVSLSVVSDPDMIVACSHLYGAGTVGWTLAY